MPDELDYESNKTDEELQPDSWANARMLIYLALLFVLLVGAVVFFGYRIVS